MTDERKIHRMATQEQSLTALFKSLKVMTDKITELVEVLITEERERNR